MTKESDLFYLDFLNSLGVGASQTVGRTTDSSHPVLASFSLLCKAWKQTYSSNTNRIKMPL